jgi:glycosyltransferase involved in cell wall biosynthesis
LPSHYPTYRKSSNPSFRVSPNGYTRDRPTFEAFARQVRPWLPNSHQVRWIPAGNFKALAEVGTLYWPDPMIAKLAWQRRYRDSRAYSLCGIAYTMASKDVMAGIGDLAIAPIQPWDAINCTSQAVKTMVERLLETWADYLAQRIGARPETRVKLPIIPLGVDCDAFPQGQVARETRQRLRQQLGIAPQDLVVLFVGRLIFHAKAHPVPMYLAVEGAARSTTAKVHLIQAGWFEDEKQESAFKAGASLFSPSINHIFVDGRKPELRQEIWSAADVFISLSDNIQETFGLTPIEAMAAGLPVIVSDWNGYQETVRHRACEVYDWQVVIAAYESLWQELAELRTNAPVTAPLTPQMPPHPLCDDPFRLFAHYPTEELDKDLVLGLGSMASPEALQKLRTVWMTSFGADRRTSSPLIDRLLGAIAGEGSLTVAEILQRYGGSKTSARVYLARTLVYLLKFDILRRV